MYIASEFENPFFIKPLNFCQHIFLAHKQLQIKFETRILACQSRFAECELFQKNLLIFDIAAKRHKNQIAGLLNSTCTMYKNQTYYESILFGSGTITVNTANLLWISCSCAHIAEYILSQGDGGKGCGFGPQNAGAQSG